MEPRHWRAPALLVEHKQAIAAVAFSPDGQLLASSSGDGLGSTVPWRLLESIGTPIPPAPVGAVADGAPDARLTVEAQTALKRLSG